jgi:hypothetical protein
MQIGTATGRIATDKVAANRVAAKHVTQRRIGNCATDLKSVAVDSAVNTSLLDTQEHNGMGSNGSPVPSTFSPLRIDKAIQEQGRDLHELLQIFGQTNFVPHSSFILQTPKYKKTETDSQLKQPPTHLKQKKQGKIPRLLQQNTKGKSVLKKA